MNNYVLSIILTIISLTLILILLWIIISEEASFYKKSLSLGIKEDKRIQIGPTIGSHVGPGTFGLIFIKQN